MAGMTGLYKVRASEGDEVTAMERVMAPMPPPAKRSDFAIWNSSPSAKVPTMPWVRPQITLMMKRQTSRRPTGMVCTSRGTTDGSRRGSRRQA